MTPDYPIFQLIFPSLMEQATPFPALIERNQILESGVHVGSPDYPREPDSGYYSGNRRFHVPALAAGGNPPFKSAAQRDQWPIKTLLKTD